MFAIAQICIRGEGPVAIAINDDFANDLWLADVGKRNLDNTTKDNEGKASLWHYPHFVWGVVALFFYVAAQTGINSFFINYVTEEVPDITNRDAALLLSLGGMGLFMTGRIIGSWLMRRMQAAKLLASCALGAIITMVLVMMQLQWISVGALFACYLFESIMFPTIFALAIRSLGKHTEKASSFLIMSIVGGAIAPVGMGILGENEMANGFLIPLICFVVVALYAFRGYRKI